MYSADDVDILYAQCRPIVNRVIMRSISHRQLTIRYNWLLVIVRCQPASVRDFRRMLPRLFCLHDTPLECIISAVAEELLR